MYTYFLSCLIITGKREDVDSTCSILHISTVKECCILIITRSVGCQNTFYCKFFSFFRVFRLTNISYCIIVCASYMNIFVCRYIILFLSYLHHIVYSYLMRAIFLRCPWTGKIILGSCCHSIVHSFFFYCFFINSNRITDQGYSCFLTIGKGALNNCLLVLYRCTAILICNFINGCFHLCFVGSCFCHPDWCRYRNVAVCLNYFDIIVWTCVIQSNSEICRISADFFWILLI